MERRWLMVACLIALGPPGYCYIHVDLHFMNLSQERTVRMSIARLVVAVAAAAVVSGCASAPPAPPEPIGLSGLPARITVSEWPFWVDIPMESKDFDRAWKTVVDIVSERAAIGVLDKESGYVRTEWRPVDLGITLYELAYAVEGTTSEQRYTFRIRPAESKIRMGIEARVMPSQRWATGLRNIPNAPWVGIHRELQDRLVVR